MLVKTPGKISGWRKKILRVSSSEPHEFFESPPLIANAYRLAFQHRNLPSLSISMSFGPSSAFGGFPSATRPPISTRRVASSGSFKDDLKQSNAHTGPTPIDHPSTPSLGSWESGDRDRENSGGSFGGAISNGHSHHQSVSSPGEQQRSFSSILSPTLPAAAASPSQDPLKPFVYSREFLLSLYEENKASRRPIELARHEIATRDVGGKPWALSEWREGEKEVSKCLHLVPAPCFAVHYSVYAEVPRRDQERFRDQRRSEMIARPSS